MLFTDHIPIQSINGIFVFYVLHFLTKSYITNMVNKRNANFLLNVGPDHRGNIVDTSIQTLRKIGELWK